MPPPAAPRIPLSADDMGLEAARVNVPNGASLSGIGL